MKTAQELEQAARDAREKASHPSDFSQDEQERTPEGFSPLDYLREGIHEEDILIGDGFLERRSTLITIAQSGIGKSSAATQTCCCWACGQGGVKAFDLSPFNDAPLRVVMIQSEDSRNDLYRQSLIIGGLSFSTEAKDLISHNFKIFTLRGKIGFKAIESVRAILDTTDGCDILVLNPMSAYAEGDLSRTEDCVMFLYALWSAVLDDYDCGGWLLHHTPKTTGDRRKRQNDWTTFDYMYSGAGAATITNYARAIVTVDAVGNSTTFAWRVAKRLRESGWPLSVRYYKWSVESDGCRLWVPASATEGAEAKRTKGKTLQDLFDLVPATLEPIPKDSLERKAIDEEGFTRREYRSFLADSFNGSTPEALRLYEWKIYNPEGGRFVAICRKPQPEDEKPEAIKARIKQQKLAEAKILKMPKADRA
jgi:AAA domain